MVAASVQHHDRVQCNVASSASSSSWPTGIAIACALPNRIKLSQAGSSSSVIIHALLNNNKTIRLQTSPQVISYTELYRYVFVLFLISSLQIFGVFVPHEFTCIYLWTAEHALIECEREAATIRKINSCIRSKSTTHRFWLYLLYICRPSFVKAHFPPYRLL